MEDIKRLNEEYVKLRDKRYFKVGFNAEDNFNKSLNNFFNEFKNLSKDLLKFGDPISTTCYILVNHGEKREFELIFSPWEIDEKLIKGRFLKDEMSNLFFTFYPDFNLEMDAFNLDESKDNSEKECYVCIPSYIFLQIYEKKEEILNKFKIKIIDILNKSISYENYLLSLSKKYSE